MRTVFRVWFAFTLLIGAACTPAASVVPTANPPAPNPVGAAMPSVALLRIAILADEGMLTPYTFKFGNPGYNMLSLVYDTILQLDADNVPKPLLAKDVKVSPDGSTYDITLRSGVRWHDGQPLTAEDVKFTYEYFLKNTQGRFT